MSEILYSEQLFAALNHSEPDGIDAGIEDIRAVTRRMHPSIVKPASVRSPGNILCNMAKARSGVPGASR